MTATTRRHRPSTAPVPAATLSELMPMQKPLLKRSDIVKDHRGKPTKTWTTGQVTMTFFNRKIGWFRLAQKAVGDDVLPRVTEVAAGRSGNRVWTLVDIEAFAFALFYSENKSYGADSLLRTLDVVYSVARLHGLLPTHQDPIATLRPMLPSAPKRNPRQSKT